MIGSEALKKGFKWVLAVLSVLVLVLTGIWGLPSKKPVPVFAFAAVTDGRTGEDLTETVRKIKICAAGDIMAHTMNLDAARDGEQYDFIPFFTEVKPIVESADFAIGNLETTISGEDKKYTGYPKFNTPDSFLDAIKWTGFDMLVTSNNHSLDRGEEGLNRTIDELDERGFYHTGTFKSRAERDKALVVDVKGIRIAFLSYTYGTNGNPRKNSYQVNMLNTSRMLQDISRAREDNPDLLVVYVHMGTEMVRQPNSEQKVLYDKLVNAGADIVLGDHPHVVQPSVMKKVRESGGSERNAFIIYSLGNLIDGKSKDLGYRRLGMILNFNIEKDMTSGRVSIKDVEYIPTWVQIYKRGGKDSFRILPMADETARYEKGEDPLLKESEYDYIKQKLGQMLEHVKNGPAK
jgi:poly-gamma-glutamate synthesis protein (capsule biosynthesis protein)